MTNAQKYSGSSGITTILLFVSSCAFVTHVIYCTVSCFRLHDMVPAFQHVPPPFREVRLTAASDFIVEALKSLGKDKVSFAYLVTCQMGMPLMLITLW